MDQICISTCANEKSPASPPPLFLMLVLAFSNLFFLFVWNTCQVVKKLAFLCKHRVIQHNALLYFQWYIGFYVFIKIVMRPEKASSCFPSGLLHILHFFYFSGLLSLCRAGQVPIWQNPSFFCTHARTYETENLLFISIASTMEARVEARREFEIYGIRHLMWMNVHALM